jgi:polar amino acid transport system permease protein
VLALSLFEGAYTSEIIRAGILSVPKGQWEAAYSLGMSKKNIYLRIIFPQAAPQMLPILASQSVSLVKDSSLVSTIAIYDLTMRGQEIVADTFLSFEIWFTVALIYLAVTGLLSLLVSRFEGKTARRMNR